MAAADGGLLFVLVGARDGLTSCTLFFLDLPGPVERADEVLGFNGGLTGEDSLDACAELVAEDEIRVVADFFEGGFKAGAESRGLGVVVLESVDCRTDSGDSDLVDARFADVVCSSIVPADIRCRGELVRIPLGMCRWSTTKANKDVTGVHQIQWPLCFWKYVDVVESEWE